MSARDELKYPPWIETRKKTIRVVGIVMSVSSVALVVTATVLTMHTESAFDEARCPWRVVETREVDGVRVEDDARECLSGLAEHRWQVVRDGHAVEIGRRRLGTELFARGVWSWTPTLDHGHVHVRVENPHAGPVIYREEQVGAPLAPH